MNPSPFDIPLRAFCKHTLALILAMTAMGLAVHAQQSNPMAGNWRASGGFIVRIPDGSGEFQLVFDRQKERVVHPARWVTVGQQFTWTDKQKARHTATIERDAKGQHRIRDTGEAFPDSPAYWYRLD